MKIFILALILLVCASANTLCIAQTPADSASHSASAAPWQWFEEHPALTGLLGALLGVLATLIGVFVSRRTKKPAQAARAGEIIAELEAVHELKEQTKTLAKASKRGELEAEREIQIEAEDENERRYLNGVLEEYGKISLYGFQSSANVKVQTLEVFTSLRLSEAWRDEKREAWLEKEDGHALSPEQVLQRAFEKRKKRLLLLIGDPGSGKTTLMKYYAICCLDEVGRRKLGLRKPLLPIMLPLRKVNERLPFCEALSAWATQKNRGVTPAQFQTWLEKRGCLVLLDGLDEISEAQRRREICEWIDNASTTYRNSHFVVTSRYSGYQMKEGIELRCDHVRADVLDLNSAQQEVFLKKWFTAAYRDELAVSDLSEAERAQEAETQAQEVADAVRNYLAQEEHESLRSMAGTPVLLQIMAILWREFGNLPPHRATLYESCTNYLLDYRDRHKKILPLLPADDAKNVLRPLSLWMQETLKEESVSAKELRAQIAEPLEKIQPGLKPQDFIDNLVQRAGILEKASDEGYNFRHKSFREFLAAGQLAEEVQRNPERAQILVENFHEGRWRETLLFALGLHKPVIFTDFMSRFLPHAHNESGFPVLLGQVIKEARVKDTAAFAAFVLEEKHAWQKRYNALECLRLIASEPAKALVKKVWEQEKKEMRLKQKAEEMLIAWKLHRVEAPAISAKLGEAGPKSFRNPLELDAEYILIKGGAYKYSVTKKEVAVPDLYFAKYPVTNKRYRRFIAGMEQGAWGNLSLEQFAESLRAKAEKIEKFKKYLEANPKAWAKQMRSENDDDKRFNADDQPVVGVTWFAAVAYSHWLNELQIAQKAERKEQRAKGEMSFRLPNEEEWEWAASGGKRQYPWTDDKEPDDTRANYGEKVGQTTPVGSYPDGATPEGLMDMAGNVWEWMENLYGEGAVFGKEARALRGGSWLDTADYLRCAARVSAHPDSPWDFGGFRLVAGQSLF